MLTTSLMLTDQAAFEQAELGGVERLILSSDGIVDLAPLTRGVRLRALVLDEVAVCDPGPLATLPGLEELSIYDHRLTDLSFLASLQGLVRLNFGSTTGGALEGRGLEGIAALPSLVELQLYGDTARGALSWLSRLVSLEALGVHRGAVTAADLAPLRALRRLELVGTGTRELAPLGALTGLVELRVLESGVSDLAPLAALCGLERLSLGENTIEDAAPLGGLGRLTTLDLHANRLARLPEALAGLARLAQLDLRENALGDVSPLAALAGLEVLDLSDNQLGDVSPLGRLPRLRALGLRRNPRLTHLNALDQAHSLVTLLLRDDEAPRADAGPEPFPRLRPGIAIR